MKNKEIAKIFYQIADFLEMDGVAFKPVAYKKAASCLTVLEEDIEKIYKEKGERGIEKIPGIGESLAKKIIEYLETGKIKYYERYKKKYPIDIESLTAVEGIGPKVVKELYKHLKIKNLDDLKKAAQKGEIRKLANFGEKTEKNILQGIEFIKENKGRFLLGEILPIANRMKESLLGLKEVKKADVCGSVRRRKETIGDIDLLVCLNHKNRAKDVMDFFCSLPGISKVWSKGITKSSVRVEEGFDVDLRIVPFESYGSALQYFTGNKEHNILLRKIAISKGFKLNEYGLFYGQKKIAGENEEEIYKKLGLGYPPPELRENQGELSEKLPKLINLKNIKGDLHCHSNWNGGENSIKEMAKEAISLGYSYIGISDHTKFLKIERGLDEKQLREQKKEIDRLNKQGFNIFHGCEANIMDDGSLDIKESALKKLDYVIAGIHSNFKMGKKEMTERIIRAIKNPYVKIISHPTGRLLNKRKAYKLDIERVFRAAKQFNTALEINSFPLRLDLNATNIKKAIEFGVLLSINSDAHHKGSLKLMEYGVSTARRGWAEKGNIINTWSTDKLSKFFNI